MWWKVVMCEEGKHGKERQGLRWCPCKVLKDSLVTDGWLERSLFCGLNSLDLGAVFSELAQVPSSRTSQTPFVILTGEGIVHCPATWKGDYVDMFGILTGFESLKRSLSWGIERILEVSFGIAALREDGLVITWGYDPDDRTRYNITFDGVASIYATHGSFAALTPGGRVFSWGESMSSGRVPTVRDRISTVVAGCVFFAR